MSNSAHERNRRRGVPVPLPVAGPLTDSELRDAPVSVSGPLTDAQLRAAAVPVSGPLTDVQLRATAVPVSLSGGLPVTADLEVTGSFTASSQTLEITLGGRSLVGIQVTGTLATLSVQGTLDGATWSAVHAYREGSTRGPIADITVASIYFVAVGGLKKLRLFSSGWGAQVANVTMIATTGSADRGPQAVILYDAVSTPGGAGLVVSGGAINVKAVDAIGGSGIVAARTDQDAVAVSGSSVHYRVISGPMLYNGATFDRWRGTINEGARMSPAPLATATLTNVNDSATSVTLLAANANRLGAIIVNDSAEVLYVKCGATASTTSYTRKLAAGETWELPFRYTGIIDGIWAADAAGAARMTEFTP